MESNQSSPAPQRRVDGRLYILEHRERASVGIVVMGVFSTLRTAICAIREVGENKGWFAIYAQIIDSVDFDGDRIWFFDVSGKILCDQPVPPIPKVSGPPSGGSTEPRCSIPSTSTGEKP